MWWATTSCSSRAIRARSSWTAIRACCSCSRRATPGAPRARRRRGHVGADRPDAGRQRGREPTATTTNGEPGAPAVGGHDRERDDYRGGERERRERDAALAVRAAVARATRTLRPARRLADGDDRDRRRERHARTRAARPPQRERPPAASVAPARSGARGPVVEQQREPAAVAATAIPASRAQARRSMECYYPAATCRLPSGRVSAAPTVASSAASSAGVDGLSGRTWR